jgi:YD repeat-containing protein
LKRNYFSSRANAIRTNAIIASFSEGSNERQFSTITDKSESGAELGGRHKSFSAKAGRTATHTGGGLAANSATNSNTATVALTIGDQSYALTRTVFDRAGRTTNRGDDNGAISTTAYDGANRPIFVADALGNTTATTFDNNGNPVIIIRTELSTLTEPAQTAEIFTTLLAWDCMNRQVLLAQSGPDGSIAASKGINLARLTFTGYDSRGNTTLNIDPNGNTTVTLWDGANRKLETRQRLQ